MMLPAVCVPKPAWKNPAAAPAAEPEDEPPGVCAGLRGIGGGSRMARGELGGHRLADRDRPRPPRQRHRRRVRPRPVPGPDRRAVLRRHVGGVQHVLDAEHQAMQRPDVRGPPAGSRRPAPPRAAPPPVRARRRRAGSARGPRCGRGSLRSDPKRTGRRPAVGEPPTVAERSAGVAHATASWHAAGGREDGGAAARNGATSAPCPAPSAPPARRPAPSPTSCRLRPNACRRSRRATCCTPGTSRGTARCSASGARRASSASRNTSGRAGPTEIAIADPDAGAWTEAIDRAFGLETLTGLALVPPPARAGRDPDQGGAA